MYVFHSNFLYTEGDLENQDNFEDKVAQKCSFALNTQLRKGIFFLCT